MAIPTLNWSSLCDHRDPKFMVKGTRLSQAVYGWRRRYAIVEIRELDGGVYWRIADAEAANDAHYAAGGETPLLPGRYDDPSECAKIIDAWSDRRRAEYDAFMSETD